MHLALPLAALPLTTALLLVPACIIDRDPDQDLPQDTSAVIISDQCPGIPAVVEDAQVVGDDLVISAGYGGCSQTEVWACWDRSFLESSPVQAPITIHHRDAGDCDAYLQQTVTIDLTPVIDGHVDAYGGVDTIVLRVGERSPVWEP